METVAIPFLHVYLAMLVCKITNFIAVGLMFPTQLSAFDISS